MSASVCASSSKKNRFVVLAVLVLALGIGGAMTQFAVVNAIVLRGFSFPHPEQLVSVGLIDPKASDQNNNFGNGNIPAAQDYEDIKAAQKSFAMMAGYLNGSTINVTYNNNPQRYTGAYITEELFKIIGVSPVLGRDFTADDNKAGAPKTAILGDKIWRRDFNADPNIVGQSVTINGKAATIIGVMPPGFEFPISEELWTPLYNEWPPTPRGELFLGANSRAPAVMGRLEAGRHPRSGERGDDRDRAQHRGRQSENEPEFHLRQRHAADQILHRRATAPDRLGDARRGHRRLAHRLRERDEHAVRPRCACARKSWPFAARSAPRAGDSSGKCLRRAWSSRSSARSPGRLLAFWGTDMFDKVVKAAPFPPPYWWRFTIDGRVLTFTLAITLVATDRLRFAPGFPQLARQPRRSDERRRPRQQQPSRQRHHPRPRRRANRPDRRAAHRRDVADQIDPQPNEARLRLRRERPLRRAPRLDGRRRIRPKNRAAISSLARSGRCATIRNSKPRP